MKKLLLIALFLTSNLTLAGVNSYQCEIKNQYFLVHSELEIAKKSSYKDIRFSVNRRSGELISDVVGLPTVYKIDHGSRDNSFKVLYTSIKGAPNIHVEVLVIKEYAEGEAKPFTITSGTDVKTGICR